MLQSLSQYFFGTHALSSLAKSFGMQYLVRWEAPLSLEDSRVGESKVLGKSIQALVGAIYKDQGRDCAKEFIHKHILSQPVDPVVIMNFDQPKRMLVALAKRKNLERPVSRLLKETGRFTTSPVFIVGMFSGVSKIGEGFGSSIKMAEFRAAKDALTRYYGKEEKDFILPSITDSDTNAEFQPNPLKDTPAYL
ncbi:hypothetical protein BB559_003335 [Furculomyces boomerangus]|nr:hypothetical protein BB559_006344 [Furculomyces boomerangus]PVU93322.1 hypothetical protein BB559_003335 [Furculomyces boomerangus]